MDLSALQTLIGDLTSDPNHDRYTLAQIGTELDNTMDSWNVEAKIIKSTKTWSVVSGTRQHALSGLTGTPISFPRVTFKGLELEKKSKTWLDLYHGTDWTLDNGTPMVFIIEAEDPSNQYLTVHPTPGDGDAGGSLVAEYVVRHTSMAASANVPFMVGAVSNSILRPFDYGLAYDVSARLLGRDPSQVNTYKAVNYQKEAGRVLANVVQVFKALEKEEPMRLRGGRPPYH